MVKTKIMEEKALKLWKNLYLKYLLGVILKILLLSFSVFLLTDIILNILFRDFNEIILIIIGFFILSFWSFIFFKTINYKSFYETINHKYLFFEFSSHLILSQPNQLLPQLQREKILEIFTLNHKKIKVITNLKTPILIALSVIFIYFIFTFFPNNNYFTNNRISNNSSTPSLPTNLIGKLPQIDSFKIIVDPPSYTHLNSQSSDSLSLDAPEGSVIIWNCELQNPVKKFEIIYNGKDTVPIPAKGNKYNWKILLQNSLFYQIRYGNDRDWFISPIYTLRSIEDKPPLITVKNPPPYSFIMFGKKPEIEVLLKITDDYGLDKTHLVATVSRGSGESVKFREVEIKFKEVISDKKIVGVKRKIDFNELKMEPGDELYFYAEASDRSNKKNKSRSDMYFVQWEDTTTQKLSITAGISLDNVPAYFRSQRQIIIDTEKLLSDKKNLSVKEFNKRSNDLGVDQKILRLRYGQFLGEEFEGNIGGHSHEEKDEHEQQKTKNTDEKTIEKLDDHNHSENLSNTFGQSGDISQYMHIHDVNDVATFFDETLKTQLKAALAQMWDAELRLRTMRPKEALPFEYKALALIKALQQKSRVYVEKSGFQPTPLKPFEKRLTGNLEDISNTSYVWSEQIIEKAYPDLRKAIGILEKLKTTSINVSALEKLMLEKAGNELSSLILKQPGINISILKNLREIINGNKSASIASVQYQLIRLLPLENKNPGKINNEVEPEIESFLKKISN